jgi:hypothetical protein
VVNNNYRQRRVDCNLVRVDDLDVICFFDRQNLAVVNHDFLATIPVLMFEKQREIITRNYSKERP